MIQASEGRWIDCGTGPSPAHVLSQTSAKILVQKSPLHARLRKLREVPDDPTDEMDLGAVVHAMLLGKGKGFAVAEYAPPTTADEQLAALVDRLEAGEDIDGLPFEAAIDADGGRFPGETPKGKAKGRKPRKVEPPPVGPEGKPEWQNWLRGDAKAARAQIRARGLIPILPKTKRMAEAGAKKIRESLARFGITLEGVAEPGVEWSEFADDGDEVTCWGALDLWQPERATIIDLKIVESAHPKAIERFVPGFGCDIQATAYTRAVEAIHPQLQGRVRFLFLFCEIMTGAVTPVELGGGFRQLGASRWRRAVNTWARCLRTNEWPGYVQAPLHLECPEYLIAAEMAAQHDSNDLARYLGAAQHDDEGDSDDE